jgi:hypothetical protein
LEKSTGIINFYRYDYRGASYNDFIRDVASFLPRFENVLREEIPEQTEEWDRYFKTIPYLAIDAYFCFVYDADKEAGFLPKK